MNIIAFDSHKRYTWATAETRDGTILQEKRVNHERGCFGDFLSRFEPGSPVAVETIGNWYWIADEIEQAGMVPHLVHAGKAKLMMGLTNKTDKLDARGLNRLQRSGTLPTVWIPPREVRDKRELLRTRMMLVNTRTRLKNRILAIFAKYGVRLEPASDAFGVKGIIALQSSLTLLPEYTHFSAELLVDELMGLRERIRRIEQRLETVFESNRDTALLKTIPGVGAVLSRVIQTEIGDVSRFATAERLASYAGTTPRVKASGGKIRIGRLRPDVNRYLKWSFVEAANVVCRHRRRWPHRHVARVYDRVKHKKNHPTAIGAVARHLAEATFWVLSKGEPYKEPVSSKDR